MRTNETERLLKDVSKAVAIARARGVTARACIFDATAAAVDGDARVWPSPEARHIAEEACKAVDPAAPATGGAAHFHKDGGDGGVLPPYSGEETTCPKCSHPEAYTKHQRALALGMLLRDDSAGTLRRGPLPERLRRECKSCEYSWDEDLCPPGCGMTVDALAHALAQATPFPMEIPTEAHAYTARQLLNMVTVTARPDHPVWQYDNGQPAPQPAPDTAGICEVVHETADEETACENRRAPQPEPNESDR